ncbi:hypothetical protein SAMN05216428_102432 [Nitrosospira sp. Nsp11]|nr:hypothetical protein SAMN05216428_102432 [Nitrosospira sp. Nsp11]
MENYSTEEIRRITGCSKQTAKRWQSGQHKPPAAALAMMRLFIDGDLSALIGPDWQGFIARDGNLYVPGWTRGFKPDEIRAMFYGVQLSSSLKREHDKLRAEIDAQQKTLADIIRQRDFYRSNLVLESKMGLALTKS